MKKILLGIGIGLVILGGTFCFLTRDRKLSVSSTLVQKLYNKINVGENVSLLRYLYEKPGVVEDTYKISVGLKEYIKKNGQKDYIKASDIEPYVKEVFGKNIDFNHQTAYLLFGSYCGYRYDATKKEYEFLSGCDGEWASMHRQIIAAEKKGKEVIITEKSIYVEHDVGIDGSIDTVFNNINKVQQLKVLKESEGKYEIKLNDYIDKASTYRYIFEKEGKNYIFKKLELVK